jgi:hypothetical protein
MGTIGSVFEHDGDPNNGASPLVSIDQPFRFDPLNEGNNRIVPSNGLGNEANSDNASVLAGINNIIGSTATNSAILAGEGNTLNAINSSILGGTGNIVMCSGCTIINGANNTINTPDGKYNVIANGQNSTLTDGIFTKADNVFICGSNHTVVGTTNSFISGLSNSIDSNVAINNTVMGWNNTINGGGSNASIIGYNNEISGNGGQIVMGTDNSVDGARSIVISRNSETMSGGGNEAIIGGELHYSKGVNSFIGGGTNNRNENANSSILGGSDCRVYAINSCVISGNNCEIPLVTSNNSVIIGGYDNTISTGDNNIIVGGEHNENSHNRSVILGGTGIVSYEDDATTIGGKIFITTVNEVSSPSTTDRILVIDDNNNGEVTYRSASTFASNDVIILTLSPTGGTFNSEPPRSIDGGYIHLGNLVMVTIDNQSIGVSTGENLATLTLPVPTTNLGFLGGSVNYHSPGVIVQGSSISNNGLSLIEVLLTLETDSTGATGVLNASFMYKTS